MCTVYISVVDSYSCWLGVRVCCTMYNVQCTLYSILHLYFDASYMLYGNTTHNLRNHYCVTY